MLVVFSCGFYKEKLYCSGLAAESNSCGGRGDGLAARFRLAHKRSFHLFIIPGFWTFGLQPDVVNVRGRLWLTQTSHQTKPAAQLSRGYRLAGAGIDSPAPFTSDLAVVARWVW